MEYVPSSEAPLVAPSTTAEVIDSSPPMIVSAATGVPVVTEPPPPPPPPPPPAPLSGGAGLPRPTLLQRTPGSVPPPPPRPQSSTDVPASPIATSPFATALADALGDDPPLGAARERELVTPYAWRGLTGPPAVAMARDLLSTERPQLHNAMVDHWLAADSHLGALLDFIVRPIDSRVHAGAGPIGQDALAVAAAAAVAGSTGSRVVAEFPHPHALSGGLGLEQLLPPPSTHGGGPHSEGASASASYSETWYTHQFESFSLLRLDQGSSSSSSGSGSASSAPWLALGDDGSSYSDGDSVNDSDHAGAGGGGGGLWQWR